MREMILANDEAGRRAALDKLLPIQRKDFKSVFTPMAGKPVTVRLLDPPLHEFVPHEEENQQEMAKEMGSALKKSRRKLKNCMNSIQC
jgi:pyruvate,orthophosphate dikinase